MNEPKHAFADEIVLWSATINDQYVRLVVAGPGSAWRCNCGAGTSPASPSEPPCEHIRFGFDVWFGRDSPQEATITDVVEHSRQR